MAEQAQQATKEKVKYYRNKRYASGSYVTRMSELDPTDIDVESFKPVRERYQGDDIYVGYIATSTKRVQDMIEAETFTEEITEAEYNQAVNPSAKKSGK